MTAALVEDLRGDHSHADPTERCSIRCAEADVKRSRRCRCQCHGRNHGKGVGDIYTVAKPGGTGVVK